MSRLFRLIKRLLEVIGMILPIIKVGGGPNISELTAGPGDVLAAEKFIGARSEDTQTGNIIQRGSPEYVLPINGVQKLPPGNYTGGNVKQSIETMAAQSVGPGARMITIPTAGKYMTGDITIRAVKNLSTSVVKKGQYVGGVGPGTWEGYVNTDPFTPYFYGTFNGLQSITAFKYYLYKHVGEMTLNKDSIEVYVKNNFYLTTLVFNAPVDVTNKSRLTIRLDSTSPDGYNALQEIRLYRNLVTDYMVDDASSANQKPNPNLGAVIASKGTSGGGDFVISLNGISGEVYVYLNFVWADSTTKLYMVKFE